LDKILEGKDLIRALRNRHKEMEAKRRKDAGKVKDLQTSVKLNRDLPCPVCTAKDIKCDCFKIQLFPEDEVESVTDTHTTADWKDIVNVFTQAVGKEGQAVLEPKDCKLVCALKTVASSVTNKPQLIKFEVQIYKSREYQKPVNSNNNDDEKHTDDTVYVVRIHRLEGDLIEYRKVRKYLFDSCAEVLTGLPQWALNLEEQAYNNSNDDNDNYDEYDDLLKNDLQDVNVHNENLLISV